MRGLPPIPSDVALMQQLVSVDGYQASFAHWLFVPDAAAATVPYLHDLVSSYQFDVSAALLNCMHAGASFVTCRIGFAAAPHLQYTQAWPANHGAWTGGQANAIATGFYVLSSSGGKGSGSRTRIPGAPDIFLDSGARLSNAGRGNLQELCTSLDTWVSAQLGPTGGQVLLGTLQRQAGGAPLPNSVFDPAAALLPSLRVEVVRRRLPKPGQVSPT